MSLADLNTYSGNSVTFTANKSLSANESSTVLLPVTTWPVARDLGNLATGTVSITHVFPVGPTRDTYALTTVGNTVSSNSQSYFGTTSIYTDGNDGIVGNYDTRFNFASDFTIEFWCYIANADGTRGAVAHSWGDYGGVISGWYVATSSYDDPGAVGFSWIYTNGTKVELEYSPDLPLNEWLHIAVVRNTNNLRIYVDGEDVTSGGYTMSALGIKGSSNNEGIVIGGIKPDPIIGSPTQVTNGFTGYLDEIRISDVARYTQDFEPPTNRFVSDSNTLLLVHAPATTGQTSFTDDNNNFGIANIANLLNTNDIVAVSDATTITANVTTISVGNISTAEDYLAGQVSIDLPIDLGNFTLPCTTTIQNGQTFVINTSIDVIDVNEVDKTFLDPIVYAPGNTTFLSSQYLQITADDYESSDVFTLTIDTENPYANIKLATGDTSSLITNSFTSTGVRSGQLLLVGSKANVNAHLSTLYLSYTGSEPANEETRLTWRVINPGGFVTQLYQSYGQVRSMFYAVKDCAYSTGWNADVAVGGFYADELTITDINDSVYTENASYHGQTVFSNPLLLNTGDYLTVDPQLVVHTNLSANIANIANIKTDGNSTVTYTIGNSVSEYNFEPYQSTSGIATIPRVGDITNSGNVWIPAPYQPLSTVTDVYTTSGLGNVQLSKTLEWQYDELLANTYLNSNNSYDSTFYVYNTQHGVKMIRGNNFYRNIVFAQITRVELTDGSLWTLAGGYTGTWINGNQTKYCRIGLILDNERLHTYRGTFNPIQFSYNNTFDGTTTPGPAYNRTSIELGDPVVGDITKGGYTSGYYLNFDENYAPYNSWYWDPYEPKPLFISAYGQTQYTNVGLPNSGRGAFSGSEVTIRIWMPNHVSNSIPVQNSTWRTSSELEIVVTILA